MKTTKRNDASNAPTANATDGILSVNTASETQMPVFDCSLDEPPDDIFNPPDSMVSLPSVMTTPELSENTLPEIRIDEPYFWRKTTDEDVKAAIKGSYLETICEVLAKNYRGKVPFRMILGQAILLMGIALTH